MLQKPQPNEYNEYYQGYIDLVKDTEILKTLEHQFQEFKTLLASIDEEKSNFRYETGKWSIKEVLGHLIDSERIFSYRALRIARNDNQPLPGFEQDDYIKNSNYDGVSFKHLAEEFALLRAANILMFVGFTDEMWPRKGTVDNKAVSVRALVYILAGHTQHHWNILKEKYNC